MHACTSARAQTGARARACAHERRRSTDLPREHSGGTGVGALLGPPVRGCAGCGHVQVLLKKQQAEKEAKAKTEAEEEAAKKKEEEAALLYGRPSTYFLRSMPVLAFWVLSYPLF